MIAVTDVAELVGRYTLTKVNGRKPGTHKPVVLQITADPDSTGRVRVETRVANTMGGFLEIRDGKANGALASTRMAGSPAERRVEGLLNSCSRDGMEVSRSERRMKMTCATGTLEWVASASAA